MPNGGSRLSIDLNSSAIAATLDRHGTRIPVLLNGGLTMPHGVALDPTGHIQVGVSAASQPPAKHQFVSDPLELLGRPAADQPIDGVQLLAAQLWHAADQAARQISEPITALTVTIPPNWGPRRRAQLADAAARAGLPAPAMVTAPAALAAYTTIHGLTAPDGSCLLICQADRHPVTLTILQASPEGYRELATRTIDLPRDLNHVLAQRIVDAATNDDDPLRGEIALSPHHQDSSALLESVRLARQLLMTQDRAPVLLPASRKPTVITHDDVVIAAQPLLDGVHHAVHDTLEAADLDSQHLSGVILRQAEAIPGLQDRLTTAAGLTPAVLADQSHALADGALALTAPHQQTPTAAGTSPPRVRLRIRDLTSALLLGACSLTLLLQAIFTADITTMFLRVVGVRTSLPQLGAAGALAMLTALAVAHLAPTTWLAGAHSTSAPDPTTGSLVRRGYLAAAVGGAIAAVLYGLATGTSVRYDYSPFLKWTLSSALPLAVCAAVIAATAPRIPANTLPAWLARTRPAILHAAIATTGIYLMRAALTITPPVDLTGMPGLIGSAGAALLGVATALTVSGSRTIRMVTAPGLGLGYAIVFTNDTNGALIVGYLVALSWWGIGLSAHTLRLAFPTAGPALRRLIDGREA
ncbi:hypothetical protein [Micromonospora sp. NPDC005707]|uniref:hypothetical protein n=1 Tax=Micromonospora sp. NPDC005707 TaxID=3157050 RepID=UPI0033CB834F